MGQLIFISCSVTALLIALWNTWASLKHRKSVRALDTSARYYIDHGEALYGLTDDDHTQYALLAGRSGQTFTGVNSFTSPDFTTSLTTTSESFTAFAGATTLLTIGGTGASASLFAPSTLDASSSTTGAIRTSGGISCAKSLNIGTTLTAAGHCTLEGVTSTGATGTGKFVFDGTPTLITPEIGAATGTSLSLTSTDPLVSLFDTSTANSSGYLDLIGNTIFFIVSRNPNTGVFKDTSLACAQINLVSASADSRIDFYTHAANNAAPTLRATIDKNGNFGVGGGTTTLTNPFHVYGVSRFTASTTAAGLTRYLLVTPYSDDIIYIDAYGNAANSGEFKFRTNDGANETLWLKQDKTIAMAGYGAGTTSFLTGGVLSSSSDERLKDIKGLFDAGLKEIMHINPILYEFNKDSGFETGVIYAGFSAQNVMKYIPEAVGKSDQGFYSLEYKPLIAALFNAIKELKQEIDDLKTHNKLPVVSTDVDEIIGEDRIIVSKVVSEAGPAQVL